MRVIRNLVLAGVCLSDMGSPDSWAAAMIAQLAAAAKAARPRGPAPGRGRGHLGHRPVTARPPSPSAQKTGGKTKIWSGPGYRCPCDPDGHSSGNRSDHAI